MGKAKSMGTATNLCSPGSGRRNNGLYCAWGRRDTSRQRVRIERRCRSLFQGLWLLSEGWWVFAFSVENFRLNTFNAINRQGEV